MSFLYRREYFRRDVIMPDEIKFEQNQIDYQFLVIKSHFFFTPVENRLESRSGLSRGQMITDVEQELFMRHGDG